MKSIYILVKKIISVIVVTGLLAASSYSQDLPTVISPPPNASSLGQYGDYPVSYYTGVPSISIPLCSATSGEIQLPISLSYHASGIKVAQEASLVGLGWALNAGGTITRQVRGKDDLEPENGFLLDPNADAIPPATAGNLPDFSDTLKEGEYFQRYLDISNGYKDGEPDVFYYNFFGQSGKFVYQKSNGPFVPMIIEQNNLRITLYQDTADYNKWKFKITDGNGWVYTFGQREISDTHTQAQNTPFQTEELTINPNNPTVMAWYLTEVVTPIGDTMTFLYDDPEKYNTIGQVNYSEIKYHILDFQHVVNRGPGGFGTSLENFRLFSASMQATHDVYLKRIEFDNGYITFQHDNRDDMRLLPFGASTPPQFLDYLEVYNTPYDPNITNNTPIKKIDFSYDYFNAPQSGENYQKYKRLRLDKVHETYFDGSTPVDRPGYELIYKPIPPVEKSSYSVDYWGYHNNRNNYAIPYTTVLPLGETAFDPGIAYELSNPQPYVTPYLTEPSLAPEYQTWDGQQKFFLGANREPNPITMDMGMLQSIKYPTGGITKFEYEPHDFSSNVCDLFEEQELMVSEGQAFTLNEATLVRLRLDVVDVVTNSGIELATLTNDLNSDVIIRFYTSNNGEYFYDNMVWLPAGSYKLNMLYSVVQTQFQAFFRQRIPVNKKIIGGLRIKSIENKNFPSNLNNIDKTIFDYGGITSAGQLLTPLKYFYNENIINRIFEVGSGYVIEDVYVGNYLVTTASNINQLGTSSQGNAVGYDKVAVSKVDSFGNPLGRSEYTYRNSPSTTPEGFLPNSLLISDISNGQLLSESTYNQYGDLLVEKTIEYQEDESVRLSQKGISIYKFFHPQNNSFQVKFYDAYSKWWYPSKETTTVYDENGQNPITMITNLQYQNPVHKNLTSSISTNSKGETIEKKLFYSDDSFTGASMPNSVLTSMVTDNVLNPVLKQETTLEGKTSVAITNYKIQTGANSQKMYLVDKVTTAKESSAFEDRTVFHEYDDEGRIKEVSKTDGVHIVYVWGYNNEYPIAKIENATFETGQPTTITIQQQNLIDQAIADADADVDTASEDTLRASLTAMRDGFPQAMVTTYTYDPIIGMTSMTDPRGYTMYYTYDTFNQLKEVKDDEGHIITDYDYHYRGETN